MAKIQRSDLGRMPAKPKALIRAPKGALVNQLFATARAARSALDAALADLDLHAGQDRFLQVLAEAGSLPPGVIADRMGVRAQTVTRMVQRMESGGFILREPSKDDGRVVEIALSPLGHEAARLSRRAVRNVEKALFADLGKKERKLLLRLLERAEANAEAD